MIVRFHLNPHTYIHAHARIYIQFSCLYLPTSFLHFGTDVCKHSALCFALNDSTPRHTCIPRQVSFLTSDSTKRHRFVLRERTNRWGWSGVKLHQMNQPISPELLSLASCIALHIPVSKMRKVWISFSHSMQYKLKNRVTR